MKIKVKTIIAVSALLTFTACSGGDGGGSGGTGGIVTSDQDTIVQLPVQDLDLDIDAGTRVTWDNSDGSPHHFVSDDGGWDSGVLNAKEGAFSYTFDQPGVYHYQDVSNGNASGMITVR
jgi:plastocyanin